MKYYEVEFSIDPYCEDASDLLAALAGEAGFESFEETASGLKGYVQQGDYDDERLKEAITNFPFVGTTIAYELREAEYKDWNEEWEQAGFEPITIGDKVLIHDGRHTPSEGESHFDIEIEIDARQAFGTGTHETTRLMVRRLLDEQLSGKRLLDCGTGTGILSVAALKLGAAETIGYDIDEWSADNARHNAVINRVDKHFKAILGDASVLNNVGGKFDIIVANINRNILLADMKTFLSKLADGGTLLLSGFYCDDSTMLCNHATELGLTFRDATTDNNWTCLRFTY